MLLIRSSLCKIFKNTNKAISSHGRSFAAQSEKPGKSEVKAQPTSSPADVQGLSSKVLNVPSTEVGSGASKNGKYKNPEYFCYNPSSYFDAELEMLQYRCPQPSALKK